MRFTEEELYALQTQGATVWKWDCLSEMWQSNKEVGDFGDSNGIYRLSKPLDRYNLSSRSCSSRGWKGRGFKPLARADILFIVVAVSNSVLLAIVYFWG